VGFVAGLDYSDPNFRPFEAFQQFKNHPRIRPLFEGGEILAAGARTVAAGGWQSIPQLAMPGAVLIGDTAGGLNVPKIKGVHQAIRSGSLAAEEFVQAGSMQDFEARWRQSPGGQELKRVRNIKPGFKRGLWLGLANAALETATAGRLPWTLKHRPDHEQLHTLQEQAPVQRHWQDRTLPPRDRLASVFFAGTTHEESQPVHLKVRDPSLCADRCAREFGNPCQRFCPANVYEMVDDGQGGKRLQINAANCVHCKACDIKDPYGVIDWTTPEGGSGPNYQAL
jgi:electron-transferring-flavoprotein dehydrogenase